MNLLITGGTGTLGRAIVKDLKEWAYDWNITVYSRSELAQAKMRAEYPHVRYVIGDVRDFDRLNATIAGHDTVIHAGALKRIPEAEANPTECYQTNVLGSQNVVRACIANGVERCVGISTDKACRAITAYGASKLMMEKIFQAHADDSVPTIFTLVRYGNVVASNGSVIPLWRKAHAEGRPLNITDIRCTRFWMDTSEAVRLVFEAMKTPAGSILVPKMQKLSLVNMAQILIPNANLHEVGMRSCEKLHEDLVHEDEPAIDMGRRFLLGRGGDRLRYTSQDAPDLDAETFLRWVSEAE